MTTHRDSYVHPSLRHTPQKPRNPAMQAYAHLITLLATNAPVDGLHDAKQLPALTNEQRAVVLRACPDVLNDIEITCEGLADVFDGNVEPGLYLWAQVEPLIRRWVFLDVCAELEADAERQRADESDALANAAISMTARGALR